MSHKTRSGRGWITVARPVVAATCLATFLLVAGAGATAADDPVSEARAANLELYGGGATPVVAEALGVDELGEKPLEQPPVAAGPVKTASTGSGSRGAISDKPPQSPHNQAVRYFPNVSENEPTVAVNPRDPDRLVAGTHFIGDTANRCVAHYSSNGGKTWSAIPIFMPQLTHDSQCSDPVLAYAPDGSRVYYAYMDIDFATTFKILVSYSDDDGRTWTGPIIALSHPAADYDKPWIGTHVRTGGHQSNRNWVYVSATRFDFFDAPADCHIDFTRSSNKGLAWSGPQTLDSADCLGLDPFIPTVPQGSRPTGGLGGGVLVAWYHSGGDGFLNGTFEIRTRYSVDNGATFGPLVTAATDSFELKQFLGPDFAYHRWWGGMFPDVEIARNGSAHILYTHDPEDGSTVEDGNIRYIGSTGPPYGTWTAPATVNDDASGRAQGWATLEAIADGSRTRLYALWEDHRTSAQDNLHYDVFWAKRTGSPLAVPGSWTPNRKLTDVRSVSDFIFLGDYFDLAIASEDDDDDDKPFVYGVWTDRRDEIDIFDFDDDVWGARIDRSHDDDDDDD